jgi:processive 1,2-diacylglycerol beta-glucosyltransferase
VYAGPDRGPTLQAREALARFSLTLSVTLHLLAMAVAGRLRAPGQDRAKTAARPRPDGRRILVLTAGVGGGHEAAGRSIAEQLESSGYEVVVEDGMRTMSRFLHWSLTRSYRSQARDMSELLAVTFAATSSVVLSAAIRWLVGLLYARPLSRLLRAERPDAVVSTYPLVNAALGRMRRRGTVSVPAVAVVADYGVHPLWVAPGLDYHLVASLRSAELAVRAGAVAVPVRIPVREDFRHVPTRDVARAQLGIPEDALVALTVGGVWEIGDLEAAAVCAVESGAYAVVVTGENQELKQRLEEGFSGTPNARILGWRSDMPVLMAAADCLLQNAGGMTCTEAIEVGLPILIFKPIPGHGEFNAIVMEHEGVARIVPGAEELCDLMRLAAKDRSVLTVPQRAPANTEIDAFLRTLLDHVAAATPGPKNLPPGGS